MKFLMLIPYTDLRDERARVEVVAFEAETEAAAKTFAEQVRRDWNAILDLVAEDRDQHIELAGLTGPSPEEHAHGYVGQEKPARKR